jgi:hypothetical protein
VVEKILLLCPNKGEEARVCALPSPLFVLFPLKRNQKRLQVQDEKTDMVASDVGVGLGILTALQSTGFHATQGKCSTPLDLVSKHSLLMDTSWSAWEASSESNNDGDELGKVEKRAASHLTLRGAVVKMVNLARFHLHRACDNQSDVPKEGRMALLPAVCGLHYLDALEGCDYDVLHPLLVGGGQGRGDDGNDDNVSSGSGRRQRLGSVLVELSVRFSFTRIILLIVAFSLLRATIIHCDWICARARAAK